MKKILYLVMVFALVIGNVSIASDISQESVVGEYEHFSEITQGPFDLGIANDEKLIEMLKREGKIAQDATPAEAEKALNDYLRAKANSLSNEKGELYKEELKLKKAQNENKYNNGITNGKGIKKGKTENLISVSNDTWDGLVREDKILVLLIDYNNYSHNSITSEETDMYYPEYTREHYENMIFGENGYTGPNGEKFVSMKQYYEEQSGGSYTIDGVVAGWYTASNTAEYYGGNNPTANGSDAHPRELVMEALLTVANDPTVDLSQFDREDRYDLDGDGNYREPDGLIDHLMVIHAGLGEEAGGGTLGGDAIWSHSWHLGDVFTIPGTTAEVPYWSGGLLAAYDYTIEPEDGAAGVFVHEYGHDLGLPDEYDTQYTGAGEPVSYWSIMSSGSWAGEIGGTEPTGFSPWCKEFLQSSMPGSNWQNQIEINFEDVTDEGIEVLLDQASSNGINNDAVKINLPDKENVINIPISGKYEYFSGSGNQLDNYMYTTIDLTNATNALLSFKTWYDIEVDWDYASVFVQDEEGNYATVQGNITTTSNPYGQNPGHGITGFSNGWVEAEFDLSQYVGQTVLLGFNYWTDGYVANPGFYADDISITIDETEVLFDDAEGTPAFELAGFELNEGKFYSKHYYLVEWRNHDGVDNGLAHIKRGKSVMSFDPGLVIWYVDDSYDNNWTGIHPGDGFVGVVDADQHTVYWHDLNNKARYVGSTRYQMHDAAFSIDKTENMYLDYMGIYGYNMYLKDNYTRSFPLFDDSNDYSNPDIPDAGRNIPSYGLKIRVIGQSADRSVGKILLSR